jgi:hypothetical protein
LYSSSTCRETSKDQTAIESWKKQEEDIMQGERRAQYEAEINPTRRPFHKLMSILSGVAALSALNMCIGQLVGYRFQQEGPVQYVMRFYVIILCVLAILVEFEWTKFARESFILRVWITRGQFYIFIGVLGFEQNDTSHAKNSDSVNFQLSMHYVTATAWIMVAVGVLYSLLGMCCLQVYFNRLQTEYEQRLERAVHIREAGERYFDNQV